MAVRVKETRWVSEGSWQRPGPWELPFSLLFLVELSSRTFPFKTSLIPSLGPPSLFPAGTRHGCWGTWQLLDFTPVLSKERNEADPSGG